MPGQRLSHLGRDARSFQAGDKQVPTTVEVRVPALMIGVGREVRLGSLLLFTLGGIHFEWSHPAISVINTPRRLVLRSYAETRQCLVG